MRNEELYNRFGGDRISSRQIDELIGIARGLTADGTINHKEAEYLQKWLAANRHITGQPMIETLYRRIRDMLRDGVLDDEEKQALLETLIDLSGNDYELGETLKATSLPLCSPAPHITFAGRQYCFTGTFNFGRRAECEHATVTRGATVGGVSRKTNVLVIGVYATESWMHSSFGHKIMNAVDLREQGYPLSIVSEEHWIQYL